MTAAADDQPTVADLDATYVAARNALGPADTAARHELRWWWKARRDPYFSPLCDRADARALLVEAGFFDDGVDIEELPAPFDSRWLVTPVFKAVRNAARHPTAARRAVLLMTGGFSPPHDGHLGAMHAARAALEAAGITVLAGYLSPSHDSYVDQKDGGRAALHAMRRVELCEKAVAGSDYLMVDPWESLHVGCAVNFTDVLDHLAATLHATVGHDIELHYVFGSDNAGFARAFTQRGFAVVVDRAGFEERRRAVEADEGVCTSGRVRFTWSPAAALSSSKIRHATTRSVYAVRDDLHWGVASWPAASSAARAVAEFASTIRAALERHVRRSAGPVTMIDVAAQQRDLDELCRTTAVLNLDAVTSGGHRVGVSRRFALYDGQLSAGDLVARDLRGPVRVDVPDGEYVIVDDDICTGTTIRQLQALLPATVQVVGSVSLLERALPEGQCASDVVDLRDFALGARDGGLVVDLPDGMLGRAPYALPYVAPTSRASIHAPSALPFSVAVWEANVALFDAWPVALRLSDVAPATSATFTSLGHDPDLLLRDLAAFHVDRLTRLPYPPH